MKTETKLAPSGSTNTPGFARTKHPMLWTALLLVIIFSVMFWRAFLPNYVAFSNDGPYGLQAAECNAMPSAIKGSWSDITWLGNENISPAPDVRCAMLLLPLRIYMNLYDPVSQLIAALGICFCLRQFKLAPMACILGGLAAG